MAYKVPNFRGYGNSRCANPQDHSDHLWTHRKYGRVHCVGHK